VYGETIIAVKLASTFRDSRNVEMRRDVLTAGFEKDQPFVGLLLKKVEMVDDRTP